MRDGDPPEFLDGNDLYWQTDDVRGTWAETEEILDKDGTTVMYLDKNSDGEVFGFQLMGDAARRCKEALFDSLARTMWEAPYL